MLSTRTAETEHQVGEATLYVAFHMMVGQSVDRFEEVKYLAVILQKADDGLVQSREFLVRLVSPRVVCAPAVEDVSPAIA